MSNLKQGEPTSAGKAALRGMLVKYWLGRFADMHMGILAHQNTDGDWIVENCSDGKQYVLRQTPESEPVPNRRAHWVFGTKKEKELYIKNKGIQVPDVHGYPATSRPPIDIPREKAGAVLAGRRYTTAKQGDLADDINKAVKTIMDKNEAAKQEGEKDEP